MDNMPSTITTRSLKRKTIPEEDEPEEQPRKLAAIGASRPIRALPQTRAVSGVPKPKALTKPKPPILTTTTRSTRGTSARPSKPLNRATTRSTSGTLRGGKAAEDKAARAAESARLAAEMDAEKTRVAELQSKQMALARELADARAQELSQRRELVNFSDELEDLKKQHGQEIMDLELNIQKRDREIRELNEDLNLCRTDLENERQTTTSLKSTISEQTTLHVTLTTQIETLQSQNSSLQNQNDDFARLISEYQLKLESNEKKMNELKKEVIDSEIVRRKLHNMVQELKGNIRVFCRVRPILSSDFTHTLSPSSSLTPEQFEQLKLQSQANMTFPDEENRKEIVLSSTSESATGQERKETYNFTFDRVFEPSSTQAEVFEEISLLAQSCMDGYNVCIFAYGQTGSGKSFTMEGDSSEESAGMIPRAVEQVFRVAEEMKSKGWEYTIEGQFIEIYNETINDLLGKSEFDKKKHEIKHDPKTGTTRITDITIVPLHSPSQVHSLLALAHSRRSVAATLMNERSSRSHSVFTLRISGVNVGVSSGDNGIGIGNEGGGGGGGERIGGTGEKCQGCLNLVDLAGSERLNVSFGNGFGGSGNGNGGLPDKERVKETKNINKSLSALGDVIAALGEKGQAQAQAQAQAQGSSDNSNGGGNNRHIPYRNSKLTYLLQNSLSGNSKTLMFLNLSPLAAHLNESLTSLRFATKVNNTQIGTAKKTTR